MHLCINEYRIYNIIQNYSLARLSVDMEPIPGTLCWKWEYFLDGITIHHRTVVL